MDNNTKYDKWRRFHLIYGIILSISIIAAGICLIAGCVSIYNLGNKPFSRERVADTFSGISVPVYICLFLTIAGFVLDFIYSRTDSNIIGRFKPYKSMLTSMYAKKDLDVLSKEEHDSLLSLCKSRNMHCIIRTALIVVSSVIFLVYALNSRNYDLTDINGSMIKAVYVLMPCLAVTFGYSVFTIYYNEKSMLREFDILKKLPAVSGGKRASDGKNTPDVKNVPGVSSASRRLLIRYALLTVCIVLIVYGILTGGIAAVLTKAANICTECIGLG